MKATEANLLAFIKKSPRFVIPIYQRTYSWTHRECRQLWDDVLRAGRAPAIKAHFMGSVVYIQDGLYQVSTTTPLLVIDGQQRLTSVTLLIIALARALDGKPEGEREPVEGFTARKLRNYYLVNPEEDGDHHYRLTLSQTDRETLIALVDGRAMPGDASVRVTENFALFCDWIAELEDLKPLCDGIAKLLVIDTSLTRGEDNPQLIFESMNSTGKELSQADLIRNFVLMGLEPHLQTKLYRDYWHPMELDFGQDADAVHFDPFMRHYLTYRTGDIPRQDAIYEAFKAFSATQTSEGKTTEDILSDVRQSARCYCAMALPGKEADAELSDAFKDLRELKVEVAYPLLLELYEDYKLERLPKPDFVTALQLIEAFVFRRSICNLPTNGLNKIFSQFGRTLKKDRYLESLKASFLLMQSYRRFPSDTEFERDIQTRDLYNFPRKSYWLRRFENFGRKERVVVEDYTIEHIMPQNKTVSSAWIKELGPDWETIHKERLHTLGNLTLTAYNSVYSDRPFAEKRDINNGLGQSPLKLNKHLGQVETWNLEAIEARAKRLASKAVTIWPSPVLPAQVLQTYRPKQQTDTRYTDADHPNLVRPKARQLFDAVSAALLALDPSVRREYLKHYIAFKSETNFTDVVVRADSLGLSFIVPFAEIDDPRGLCRDVSKIGRWANGQVEARLTDLADLPYLMRFARQALNRQLGYEDEEP
jgi:uncharacterized protein with ParB-like and HNH nuclease domain/predicted transport protein